MLRVTAAALVALAGLAHADAPVAPPAAPAAPAAVELPGRAIGLREALAAASRAPAAAIAVHEIAAATAETDAAGAWANPGLHVETNRLTARLVAGVTVPLPLFGTVGAARDEAAARATVVARDAALEQRDLAHRTALAWIALARADGEIAVRTISADQAAALETMTRGKLSAGAGAEVDVTAAVAARARATVAISAARRAQAAAAAELAGLLGWDPNAPLHSDGALPLGDRADEAADLSRLSRHPERVAAEARVAAADATIARVRTGRIPALAAEFAVSIHDPTTPGTDVLAGLTLELPVFARVGDQVRAADATAAAERARLAVADAHLASALVAAERRWQAAAETATALAHDVLPAQERATALAEQAYREGARDLGTALVAERDLAALRAEIANARADVAEAWLELQLAAGRPPGVP